MQDSNTIIPEAYSPLLEMVRAADSLLWKLSHNWDDHKPARIDRNDDTARQLDMAIERYRESTGASSSLCGMDMCGACKSRWCEDFQS